MLPTHWHVRHVQCWSESRVILQQQQIKPLTWCILCSNRTPGTMHCGRVCAHVSWEEECGCVCVCACVLYTSLGLISAKCPLNSSAFVCTLCVKQLNHCPKHHTHTVALSSVCSAPPLHQLDISWWCNHSLSVFEWTQWQMFQGTEWSVGACVCVCVHTHSRAPGNYDICACSSTVLLLSVLRWVYIVHFKGILLLILVSTVIHQ